MKKLLFSLCFLLGTVMTSTVAAQVVKTDNLEELVDSLVPEEVNDTTPGLVIGVVHKGELIFSKGYGLANLAYGIPNSPDLVYNIGSVSKQFLGYAFAWLHVKGELDIDDPVADYLDDWPVFEHEVSLRHLLSHTSGYREAYTMSNLAGRFVGRDYLSREECLNVVRRQPELEFVPGSRYTYNSTAWVILAEVLEQVTGESADDWVTGNILLELGMKDTQIEGHVGEVIYRAAESYTFNEEEGYTNQKSNRAIFGAADVCSSIEDLARWTEIYETTRFGGEAVKDLFLDPFILNNGENSDYALGIGVGTYKGVPRYRHTGGHEAFATQLSYFPDQDLGIITVSNFGGKGWIPTGKIADVVLEEFLASPEEEDVKAFKIKPKKLKQYEGLYLAFTRNRILRVNMKGDSLMMFDDVYLLPTAENTFQPEGWGASLRIEPMENGEAKLSIGEGDAEVYYRAEEWHPDAAELAAYTGDYYSKELETTYHLEMLGGKLSLRHRWLGSNTMEALARDFFEVDDGPYITFIRNAAGEVTALQINTGRTLNVIFDRK